MKYLNYEIADLKTLRGLLTAKEINNQPDLWLKTYTRLIEEKKNIAEFLKKALQNKNINIVLTGAGSSAFIGEALSGLFQRKFNVPTRAVATTDIITHPDDYFVKSASTLMVSFARSGDSPESVASINFAKKYCDNFYEINITCNSKGNLATKENEENSYEGKKYYNTYQNLLLNEKNHSTNFQNTRKYPIKKTAPSSIETRYAWAFPL